MSRDAILARIRAANTTAPATDPTAPSAPQSLVSHGDGAIVRFRAAATSKGVTVVDVKATQTLPASVAEALSAARIDHRVIQLNDAALADLPWSEASLTIGRGAATPQDALAFSRALAAVAETGTLMLASGVENPTTLAFLPQTHLVAIDRTSILGTFEEATGLLRQTYGTMLPRTVNFISGASRTGDIGGRIVHGAHGPRHLFVFII
jgi:L-lactate dehydrogenase complex protein LldG